jgi:ergothioneine biosynthesis protein EgtB
MGSIGPREQPLQRESFLGRFLSVRKTTENLCAPLSHEDHMVSATEDTSPPKWHLGHTSWFFENFILQRFMKGNRPFRSDFNFIFNSYYKQVGHYMTKAKRHVLGRPSLDEILQYRKYVTSSVYTLLSEMPEEEYKKVQSLLLVGINHEEQHQELLLMDIKRNFYENPIRPRYQNMAPMTEGQVTLEPQWPNLTSGLNRIGVEKGSKEFAFDNEKGAHSQWIESCMISSHLVRNDEYLAFVEEGGYDNPLLWLSDGWDWKEKENWQHPLYWERDGQNWWTMSFAGMVPLDLASAASHISYYEAQAFAHWKGCRLPTEFEWEVAAKQEHSKGHFLEDHEFDPLAPEEDHEQWSQIHGTIWEWTQSAYLPYPRFERLSEGPGEYNGKFMCNQMVLRGGSCITPERHYRPTYRNFYYPHMRWQYAGIRLAKDLA